MKEILEFSLGSIRVVGLLPVFIDSNLLLQFCAKRENRVLKRIIDILYRKISAGVFYLEQSQLCFEKNPEIQGIVNFDPNKGILELGLGNQMVEIEIRLVENDPKIKFQLDRKTAEQFMRTISPEKSSYQDFSSDESEYSFHHIQDKKRTSNGTVDEFRFSNGYGEFPFKTPHRLQRKHEELSSESKRFCPICFGSFDSEIGSLPHCSHKFCFRCIEHWANITNICPLCIEEFSAIKKNSEIIKIKPKKMNVEGEPLIEPLDANSDDFCYVCEQGIDDMDPLLVCESCLKKCCHMSCLDPPLETISPEEWFCDFCVRDKRIQSTLPIANLFKKAKKQKRSISRRKKQRERSRNIESHIARTEPTHIRHTNMVFKKEEEFNRFGRKRNLRFLDELEAEEVTSQRSRSRKDRRRW